MRLCPLLSAFLARLAVAVRFWARFIFCSLTGAALDSKFEHNDCIGCEFQPSARVLWTPAEQHFLWATISRATVQRVAIPWLILAALVPFAVGTSMAAQIAAPSESELKAVFVYNFMKFTEWPPAKLGKSGDPFIIGILGKDPFAGALDKVVEGETIYSKPVVVRRFARADEAAASHALFISASEEQTVAAVLKLLDGQNAGVLTISETENFTQYGGVIGLKKEEKKVVFEINLIAANRAGLNISAQLLKIAKDVVK